MASARIAEPSDSFDLGPAASSVSSPHGHSRKGNCTMKARFSPSTTLARCGRCCGSRWQTPASRSSRPKTACMAWRCSGHGNQPDVIITDINMPRMDGFGFIEAVRANASRRAMPILVLTTESDAEKKERARRPAPPAGSSSPSTRPSWSTRSAASRPEIRITAHRLETITGTD